MASPSAGDSHHLGGRAPEKSTAVTPIDQLQMARLKKRKLRLRDEIAMLEGQLIPDIIA